MPKNIKVVYENSNPSIVYGFNVPVLEGFSEFLWPRNRMTHGMDPDMYTIENHELVEKPTNQVATIKSNKKKRFAKSAAMARLANYVSQIEQTAIDNMDTKELIKYVSKAVHLLRLESKGEATPDQVSELNHMQSINNYIMEVEQIASIEKLWIENSSRTLKDLEDYDPSTADWPTN